MTKKTAPQPMTSRDYNNANGRYYIEQNSQVQHTNSSSNTLARILALYGKGWTLEAIANETYKLPVPQQEGIEKFTPEGDYSGQYRAVLAYRHYVDFVRDVIQEYEDEKSTTTTPPLLKPRKKS